MLVYDLTMDNLRIIIGQFSVPHEYNNLSADPNITSLN